MTSLTPLSGKACATDTSGSLIFEHYSTGFSHQCFLLVLRLIAGGCYGIALAVFRNSRGAQAKCFNHRLKAVELCIKVLGLDPVGNM